MPRTKKLVAAMMLACGALLLMRAATAISDDTPPMTSYRNDTLRIVKYKFSYELSDGTAGKELGILKNAGTDAEVEYIIGSWLWWDKVRGCDWKFYYVADGEQFQVMEETEVSLQTQVVASLLG